MFHRGNWEIAATSRRRSDLLQQWDLMRQEKDQAASCGHKSKVGISGKTMYCFALRSFWHGFCVAPISAIHCLFGLPAYYKHRLWRELSWHILQIKDSKQVYELHPSSGFPGRWCMINLLIVCSLKSLLDSFVSFCFQTHPEKGPSCHGPRFRSRRMSLNTIPRSRFRCSDAAYFFIVQKQKA